MANRLIHIALCVVLNAMKSISTKTVTLWDAMNVYPQKAHGSLMNVFRRK
jgi:hypothetical protein